MSVQEPEDASTAQPVPKLLASAIETWSSSARTHSGKITLKGDSLSALLDPVKALTPQRLFFPVDDGRWRLLLRWGKNVSTVAKSRLDPSKDIAGPALGLYLGFGKRDASELGLSGPLRDVKFEVKFTNAEDVCLGDGFTLNRRFGEADALNTVVGEDATWGSARGWPIMLADVRDLVSDSSKLCVEWHISEKHKDRSGQHEANAPATVQPLFQQTMLAMLRGTSDTDVCFVLPPRKGSAANLYIHAQQSWLRDLPYFQKAFSFSAGSSTGLPPEARPVIPIEPPSSRKPRSRAVKASTVTKGLGTDADVREPKTPSRATREDLEPFDDSDDEFVNSSKHMPEQPPRQDEQVIEVTDFSARTYYALIQYACTGSVIYAPLRSQYKLRSQPGKEGMKMYKSFKALQTAYSESQLLPHSLSFECSPKSMFRLANKLDIADLADRALREYRKQVTPENVLDEMCHPTVHMLKELLDVCTDCIIENWESCAVREDIMDALSNGAASDNPDVRAAWLKILKSSVSTSKKRKADEMA